MAGKCSGIPFWICWICPHECPRISFMKLTKTVMCFSPGRMLVSIKCTDRLIDWLIIWLINWLAVWLSVFSSLGHFHTYLDIYYYLFIVFSFLCRHNLRFRAPKTQVFKNCPKVKIFQTPTFRLRVGGRKQRLSRIRWCHTSYTTSITRAL